MTDSAFATTRSLWAPPPRQFERSAGVACAGVVLCGLAAALVMSAGVEQELRDWYALRLPPPERGLDDALQFAGRNGRLALLPFAAAALVAALPRSRLLLDWLLAALLASNAILVGAAVGAYGEPLLRSLMLHWPLELAAFALAGGSYLEARSSGRVELRPLAGCVLLVAALLALAGLAEAEGL
jgi:hypothetical protein